MSLVICAAPSLAEAATEIVHRASGVTYREGCRCDECRRVVAREMNVYKMRRAANGGPLLVSKVGAVRRLQALMWMGWSRRELARQAGYKGDAFALILNSPRQAIMVANDQKVADLFERLAMRPGPSKRAHDCAERNGWLPPLAWTDIDDPDEIPDLTAVDALPDPVVIERILDGDWRLAATPAERTEVVARWTGSLNELARLTGWKVERYRPEKVA